MREEVTGKKDGEDYFVRYVLGMGGCWAEAKTQSQPLFHFELFACWETQTLKPKGEIKPSSGRDRKNN